MKAEAIEKVIKCYYDHRDAFLNGDENIDEKASAELAVLKARLAEAERYLTFASNNNDKFGECDPDFVKSSWLAGVYAFLHPEEPK
jgi:hypothetical protein